MVTMQLPIFNELHVVTRLLDSVAALDYPTDKLQIQVLDDSTAINVQCGTRCDQPNRFVVRSRYAVAPNGGVAQLVERLGRIEEARGSTPLTSTP